MTPEPFEKAEIAKRVRKTRIALGLSQQELADIMGTTRVIVSHWENARHRPTIAQAALLAREHGVTLDWLFLGRDGTLPVQVARMLNLIE